MNSGAYIGIIVGIVAFIILKSTCMWFLWRRRGKQIKSRLLNSTSSTMSSTNAAELLNYIEKWEIRCDDVKLIKKPDGCDWELGSGAFGRVVKGLRGGVQEVAIKMLYQSDQKAQEAFLREISMLKYASRDRNVVQFYGVSIQSHGIWLITEHMEGGDLRKALTIDGPDRVTWWKKGKQIACDVARGLAFLHSNKVIHRDLKSKNVLLTKDGEAKITDVGMAKLMSEAYYTQDASFGTFSWAAPEVLLGEKCSEKVDCYSLGVTCWEIATGLMPIRGQMSAVSEEDCPMDLIVLIADLMKRQPSARPSAAEAYRRLMACEPNPEIVPLPEDLGDASTIDSQASTFKGDPNALTWKTDLDSAEDPTLSNAPARLMQLADGASFNIDRMENSFAPVQTPGLETREDLAEKQKAQEAEVLLRLARGASNKLNAADGSLQIMRRLVLGESLTANPQAEGLTPGLRTSGEHPRGPRTGEFLDSAENAHYQGAASEGRASKNFTAP